MMIDHEVTLRYNSNMAMELMLTDTHFFVATKIDRNRHNALAPVLNHPRELTSTILRNNPHVGQSNKSASKFQCD